MAYEYEVNIIDREDGDGPKILDSLNEWGKDDWQLVNVENATDFTVFYFMRKIEVNQILRDRQLGIKPEKEKKPDDKS